MAGIDSIWKGWHAEELIGQGAYGKVYRMSRSEFGHTSYAAAKLIEIPQDASEITNLANMGMDSLSIRSYFESAVRNIVNEIAVMESLKGASNVVAIEDYRLVEHEDGIGWTICIRMELLQSMADYQKENGPPNVEETIRIGIDICNALICCEERGVIHRDVKPENVFRSAFGDYKLGDFGISRQIENSTKSVYSQKGTGHYMAPEVVRGQKYGNNVDVYSLGIMLYRYLNNMRLPFLPPAPQPFSADDMEQALLRRLGGDELSVPSEADDALAEIVLKACQADPKTRYQSARELRSDLLALKEKSYVVKGDFQQTAGLVGFDSFDEEYPLQDIQDLASNAEGKLWAKGSETTEEQKDSFDNRNTTVGNVSDKRSRFWRMPKFAFLIVLIVAAILAMSVLLPPMFRSSNDVNNGGSEYIGEWYVPTDTDRFISMSSNGDVSYGDDKHGTIASGKWTVIDAEAGAIKFTLKAESGNENMFEEGPSEFTRMAYAESAEKMSAQLYYSPSEWETYIKQ